MLGLNPSRFFIGVSDDRYNSNAMTAAQAQAIQNIVNDRIFLNNLFTGLLVRTALFAGILSSRSLCLEAALRTSLFF